MLASIKFDFNIKIIIIKKIHQILLFLKKENTNMFEGHEMLGVFAYFGLRFN